MNLDSVKKSFSEEIKNVKDAKALESVRVRYLGRKDGEITKILRSLKDLSPEEKRKVGPEANALKAELELVLEKKLKSLAASQKSSSVDLTLPGKKIPFGHLHPLTQMEDRIKEIFSTLNFSVVEGPEVETEHYNFDALNIPANHPARDMWDTFWLLQNEIKNQKFKNLERLLLRTHTSPMQVRYMEKHRPPFQIIVPGRVFRFEATDASHEINFHQVEGLMVGTDVNLANFKYVIEEFLQQLFGAGTHVRFRPSYFPFVEPGLEVDVQLNSKWLEVMGAGMVHPNVFKAVGYNPKEVQGFAFGMGLERLAMIKYKIPDIRMFYSGDLRFINQF
ncbi:MAG: phenylalanine--tRNA ligase subunit alpha [Patescibacteria group bacterium]